jgi:putative ABC transport system permease protein
MTPHHLLFHLSEALVHAASRLVPREERERWTKEWEAELQHRFSRTEPDAGEATRLFVRSWGAVRHALWHRRQSWRWDALSLDLRCSIRGLAKRPGFVLAAVSTLAVGIGVTTAVYGVADAVLLRPLPYLAADRLVFLFETNQETGGTRAKASPANVLDFRREAKTLDALAAWWIESTTLLPDGSGDAEEVASARVTSDFFRVLGVEPMVGRSFLASEMASGENVVVLSYELWQRRYGGAAEVVGSEIVLKNRSCRVIGVMPPRFQVPQSLPGEILLFKTWDLERDYAYLPEVPRDWRFLNAAARVSSGVSLEAARADLESVARSLSERFPKTNLGWSVDLIPLREVMVSGVRPSIALLVGAVGLVLLLACANVAGLLLVRASGRGRELAVRTALGASRGRLIRQVLLESSLLAGLGGALGIAFAHAAVALLPRLAPGGIFRLEETVVDGRVLAFALAVSALAGMASGLAPAFQSSLSAPAESLKGAGGVVSSDRKRLKLRSALVVSEVTIAVVLLAASALLLRSFSRVLSVDPGFDPDNVLVVRMRLDGEKYGKGGAHLYYTELLSRLRALSGVLRAGGATALPMDTVDMDFDRPFWRDGEPRPEGGGPGVRVRMPTVGYFETMRIRLLAGRLPDERDDRTRPRVVVVNETLASRTWPGESAVGKRIRMDYQDITAPYEVIGVVSDTRFASYKVAPEPEVYIPHAQNPYLPMNLVVRTTGDPRSIAPQVRALIAALDRNQPVHSLESMEDLVARHLGQDRFAAFLMAVFSVTALLLAAIGLYGVVASSIAQRERELGLRIALGADRSRIFALVLASGARIAVAGAAIGLAAALLAGGLLEGLLFGVEPSDPVSLLAAVATSMITVIAACYPSARRASRFDPTRSLQAD